MACDVRSLPVKVIFNFHVIHINIMHQFSFIIWFCFIIIWFSLIQSCFIASLFLLVFSNFYAFFGYILSLSCLLSSCGLVVYLLSCSGHGALSTFGYVSSRNATFLSGFSSSESNSSSIMNSFSCMGGSTSSCSTLSSS